MADMTKLNEMWARLDAANALVQAGPADRREPSPGDVYLWAPPNELGLDWVVVNEHPDDSALVYVVPADANSLAGLADVVVREAGREPISLRCGRGAWVRRDELAPERRYRVLDLHHINRAQEKIRQIVTGPLDGSRHNRKAVGWAGIRKMTMTAASPANRTRGGGTFATQRRQPLLIQETRRR